MTTTEIPRNEWAVFCRQFSRDYAGHPVNIETSCWETCSVYQLARRLPFSNIILTPPDGHEDTTISIMAGETPQEHVVHKVPRPSRLTLEKTGTREPRVLRIESKDGIVAMIVFQFDKT